MIRIGGKEVVFTANIVVPERDTAELEFNAGLGKVSVLILFSDDGSEKPPKIDIKLTDGVLALNFFNWKSALGAALKTPTSILRLGDGQEIFLLASVWKIGEVYKIDACFLMDRKR